MVEFKLTPEQIDIQESVREFVEKEVKAIAMERDQMSDHENIFPVEAFKKSFEIGIHTAPIPEKYGGQGLDLLTLALIWEEMAAADAGFCVSYQGHLLTIEQLCNPYYSEEIREKVFSSITGESGGLGAFSVSEPNVGPCWTLTEEGGPFFEATLVPDGDDFILNGSKVFVTNGGSPLTKYYVIMAKEDGIALEMSTRGCYVPADTPGVNYIQNENKMGQRLSQNAQMFLDNVRVPKEHVFDVSAISVEESMARTADQERLTTIHTWVTLGALCLGLSRSAYEEALKYSKTRKIAGKPAITYQLVGAKLADMYWSIESLRAFIWKVANHFDHNPMDHKMAWGCKVMGSDTAVKVTSEALQIHGGYGYSKDSLVEKLYRDAKVTQIYECPNELLRVATANMLHMGV